VSLIVLANELADRVAMLLTCEDVCSEFVDNMSVHLCVRK